MVVVQALAENLIAAEEALRVLQELRAPMVETSTLCLGCKQILQKNREDYFVGLQTQVMRLNKRVEGLAKLLKKLDEKTPDRPPFRALPPQMQVQPVSFSFADQLSPNAQASTSPPVSDTRQSQTTPEMTLQQAMQLLLQQ